MNTNLIEMAITWCGIGHFALCLGSLCVPRVLQWQKHLKDLQPLLRQMFWTYAAYILVINLSFGLLSVYGTTELLNRSYLAKCVTFFIGIYWLARIAIQFLYFDRSEAPKGLKYSVGEIALIGMFSLFTVTYLAAFLFNIEWI
jgi:hypothetical protein